jgi:hypothetical protein
MGGGLRVSRCNARALVVRAITREKFDYFVGMTKSTVLLNCHFLLLTEYN